jgi:PAS domain S-box-containing protein
MAKELRETGISVVGEMPWGTHFCYFYETKEDLLDILIPYFKIGLENNEFCLWVISNSELVTMQEATSALRKALPDLNRHLAERRIEMVAHDDWFLSAGAFDFSRVANRFKEKLDEALVRGYAGMRVNGSPAWLHSKDGTDLREFEEEVDRLFPNLRIIAACTYPLGAWGAAALLDVARTHQFAIARRHGNWDVVETPELKQAKAEINKLNEELEQRVAERTEELAAVNKELRREITERKQADEALRQSLADLAEAQRVARLGSWSFEIAHNTLLWSDELYRIFDVEKTAFVGTYEAFLSRVHPDDRARVLQVNAEARSRGAPFEVEYRITTRSGQLKHIREVGYTRNRAGAVSGMFGTAQDITEHKRVEEQLSVTSEQLRALSASLRSAREEEGTRIARELHDELGSALTSFKWDLEEMAKIVSSPRNQVNIGQLSERIAAMTTLIDTTINSLRRISSELRPSILDDLGLVAAIEWQAQQFESRTGIICQCDCFVDNVDLTQDQATALFRIVQEAMTNILRHAQATRVNIALEKEDGEFVLQVGDNGRGITEEERTGLRSLGLIGIRERAHRIGGRIEIVGVAGKGTILTVRVPLRAQVD